LVRSVKNKPQTGEKYQVQRLISSSDKTDIYLAYIEGIGGFRRRITLKKYHSLSSDQLNTLTVDAKNAGLLSHANIVQLLDLGQWDSSWYLAMEYVDGNSLEDLIQNCKYQRLNLSDEIIFYIIIEILNGLEYAHGRMVYKNERHISLNILHLNLDPSSILINRQGSVKIKGFSSSCDLPANSLFLPPDTTLDQRTDIWSVGAILQSLLFGTDKLDTRATITSQVTSPIERIMQQALHPDPDRRFQSTSAMKEAIFNQCGKISLNAPQVMADFIYTHFPNSIENFDKDSSDRPTYVSKTVSKTEIEEHVSNISNIEKIDSKPENLPPPKLKKVQQGKLNPIMASFIIMVAVAFGILIGSSMINYVAQGEAEIRLYFPTNVTVSINDNLVYSSGSSIIVDPSSSTKAIVSFPNGTKRELDFHLRPGETRLITIEHLKIK